MPTRLDDPLVRQAVAEARAAAREGRIQGKTRRQMGENQQEEKKQFPESDSPPPDVGPFQPNRRATPAGKAPMQLRCKTPVHSRCEI